MLVELAVKDLGVIEESRIPFAEGMTALTGETGAGKTMVVEALRLLSGAKADASWVRQGADGAMVEALFELDGTEWVIRRIVPAGGRSRSYVNGELVAASQLVELTRGLLEIHGQHSQQALLDRRHQREALDRFAGADAAPVNEARAVLATLVAELESLGGDERARQRQLDLLTHQVSEIEAVAPMPGEDGELSEREDRLARALEYQRSAAEALDLLGADGSAQDLIARAGAAISDEGPFVEAAQRLAGLLEELSDISSFLRTTAERIEPDEEQLAEVRARRQDVIELRRKYGESIEDVLGFLEESRTELEGLRSLDERRELVERSLDEASRELAARAHTLGEQRRAAAPELGRAIEAVLDDLALGSAQVDFAVEDTTELPGAGEATEMRLSTNPGMAPGPLSKVASGGELSRVMLALRLVLSGGPPTMIFDEVDAGIGGAAAIAVGHALGSLGAKHQVIVVTHLAQVAAFADAQVLVQKDATDGSTITTTNVLQDDERVIELSRMLSGSPESDVAHLHARELLSEASELRSRSPGPARGGATSQRSVAR